MIRARSSSLAAIALVLLASCSDAHRAAVTATPSGPPAATRAPGGWRIGPQSVRVDLLFATGTPGGLYGVSPEGDGPPYRGFRLVRVDPTTLQVHRTAVVAGDPGGLAVDNQTAYVGVGGRRAVLRFSAASLAPLRSWRDPVGVLRGPLATTRSGLWVADAHGLTRLLGDGQQGGSSARRFPVNAVLRAGWDSPGVLANGFWAVALDTRGCPRLFAGSGPDGLDPHPALAPVDCGLGLGDVATGVVGTLVTVPTGLQAGSVVVRADAATGRWTSRPGPDGSNGIQPSVTDQALFVADVSWLDCLGADGRVQARLQLGPGQALPRVVEAGRRDFLVFTQGATGAADGPRVQPFTPDRRC